MINTEQSNGFKLYHGITKFTVLGINPELIQLQNWGVKFENTPAYWDEANKTRRLDVWLQEVTQDIITKVTFFIREPKQAKTGKWQYIDMYGNTTWIADGEQSKSPYFDPQTARKAYEGEEYLTGFMKAFVSPKKGVEFRIDTIEAIYSTGKLDELKDIFKNPAMSKNEVTGAIGIAKTRYYNVYQKAFLPSWASNTDKLAKKLDEDTYKTQDYGVSPYLFKEYSATPEGEPTKEVANDLPF